MLSFIKPIARRPLQKMTQHSLVSKSCMHILHHRKQQHNCQPEACRPRSISQLSTLAQLGGAFALTSVGTAGMFMSWYKVTTKRLSSNWTVEFSETVWMATKLLNLLHVGGSSQRVFSSYWDHDWRYRYLQASSTLSISNIDTDQHAPPYLQLSHRRGHVSRAHLIQPSHSVHGRTWGQWGSFENILEIDPWKYLRGARVSGKEERLLVRQSFWH